MNYESKVIWEASSQHVTTEINQIFHCDACVNCRIYFVVIGFKIRISCSINFGVKLYVVKWI